MTLYVLTDCRFYAGGADLTGRTNKIGLAAEREDKDATTFASSGWHEGLLGLASAAVSAGGLWEAGDSTKVDDYSFANLGGLSAWTATESSGAVGDLAWLMNALGGKYTFLGQVGEIAPWSSELRSSWPAVRGSILHPSGTARTATGNGTAVQVSAASSTQYMYAALHVLSVSGTSTPTITVKVQSDVDNTFASPADQISFTAATAAGGQILRTAGANADTWYRASWTISGSSPSFLFVVSFGIF